MAAVLACGSGAALSHVSAARLWRIVPTGRTGAEERIEVIPTGPTGGQERIEVIPTGGDERIEVTVPRHRRPRATGVLVHRRALSPHDLVTRDRISVTTPVRTLLDLATRFSSAQLERAISSADILGLVDSETLRSSLELRRGEHGIAALRRVLDRRTFVVTESELERRFLIIARRAGLPPPEAGVLVNGFKVDFFWRDLGLIVETDGLRYHRTPAQQSNDRKRDQAHATAGLTPLRFTHSQITREPESVASTLVQVARRLRRTGEASAGPSAAELPGSGRP